MFFFLVMTLSTLGFFFSSRRRHTRWTGDWSSDVCSSDLLDGAVHPIDQVTKQLHKLVNVLKIRDMEPEETIAREMALFKVTAAVENRAEIMQFAEIFRAKIVDVSRRTMTIEITGSAEKVEAFERMIRPHGLVEMVRTGEIAIAR